MAVAVHTVNVDTPRLLKTFTLRVRIRGMWWMHMRCWAAKWWCWIGARLIGCKFAIDSGGDD